MEQTVTPQKQVSNREDNKTEATGLKGRGTLSPALSPVISQSLALDERKGGDQGKDGGLIQTYMSEIKMDDTNSILMFGTKAQTEMAAMSDTILEDVRAKDVGNVGEALTSMVMKLRELDVVGLDPTNEKGFIAKILGLKTPVEKYLNKYQTVRGQIDKISTDMERHRDTLLEDIKKLDKLYEVNLDYFHNLELYIKAGEAKLNELDKNLIPELEQKATTSEDMLEANRLRDLRGARDDLERRVHDLKLTRQVTMQSLPSLRMVQQNDEALVSKISSTIVNTVPLWKNQMAQAVTIHNSQQAGQALKRSQDFTNELLRKNAENLQTANSEIRRQIERGTFDIEAVKEANDRLIATINESLHIADEAKQKRHEAERVLLEAENELKQALVQGKTPVGGLDSGEE